MNLRDLHAALAVRKLISTLKGEPRMKWIPSVITCAASLAAIYHDPLTKWIGSHPQAAVVVAGIYALAKGLAPSPLTDKQT